MDNLHEGFEELSFDIMSKLLPLVKKVDSVNSSDLISDEELASWSDEAESLIASFSDLISAVKSRVAITGVLEVI